MQKLAEEKEQDNFNSELVRQIVDATGQIQAKEEREKYEEALFYAEANKQLALDAKHRKQRQKEQEGSNRFKHLDTVTVKRLVEIEIGKT